MIFLKIKEVKNNKRVVTPKDMWNFYCFTKVSQEFVQML